MQYCSEVQWYVCGARIPVTIFPFWMGYSLSVLEYKQHFRLTLTVTYTTRRNGKVNCQYASTHWRHESSHKSQSYHRYWNQVAARESIAPRKQSNTSWQSLTFQISRQRRNRVSKSPKWQFWPDRVRSQIRVWTKFWILTRALSQYCLQWICNNRTFYGGGLQVKLYFWVVYMLCFDDWHFRR